MSRKPSLTDHTSTKSVTLAGGISMLVCGVAYIALAANDLPWYPGLESGLTVVLSALFAHQKRRRAVQ